MVKRFHSFLPKYRNKIGNSVDYFPVVLQEQGLLPMECSWSGFSNKVPGKTFSGNYSSINPRYVQPLEFWPLCEIHYMYHSVFNLFDLYHLLYLHWCCKPYLWTLICIIFFCNIKIGKYPHVRRLV